MNQPYKIPDCIAVYQQDDKFLVFNPSVPSWLVTNGNGIAALQLCSGQTDSREIGQQMSAMTGKDLLDEVDNFLKEAVRIRLFDEGLNALTVEDAATGPSLNNVHLNMTNDCNLRCIYCYAEARPEQQDTMAERDYINILDQIAGFSPRCIVTFTGGEPLLSPHTIELGKYAKSRGLRPHLLTNGTLISHSNVKEIAATFVLIQISLDANQKEIHERLRGPGTFEAVTEGIALLQALDANVMVAMTVNKYNIDEVSSMYGRFGKATTFMPLFPVGGACGHSEIYITGREYYEALTSVDGVNPFKDIDDCALTGGEGKRKYKCSIGLGSLSVASNGDVFPCHLLHFAEFKLGNILAESFADICNKSALLWNIRNNNVTKMEGCSECEVRFLCGGACQARNYFETGRTSKAGSFCEYEKLGIINKLFSLYRI
jgi:radical SAM protein with 4Fe4S-binding SPASM domain